MSIPATIALVPSQVVMVALDALTFVATLSGISGSVVWSVDGIVGGNSTVGTIAGGVYTAPAAGGNHSVEALVTSGPTTVFAHASIVIWTPVATTSHVGLVRPDGTSITINPATGVITSTSGSGSVTAVSGVAPISSTGGTTPAISVGTATTAALGVVKPDGTTIAVSAGVISVNSTAHTVTMSGTTLLPGQGTTGTTAFTCPVGAVLMCSLYDPTSPGANEFLSAFAYNQNGVIGWSVVNISSASVTLLGSTILNIRVLP